MALEYATRLRQLFEAEACSLPVIMGGVLNQKVEDRELPIPVLDELRSLGIMPAANLPAMTRLLPGKSDST